MAVKKGKSSILENAVAHFSGKEIKVISVPEWAGDDGNKVGEIYYYPFTLQQKGILYRKAKNDDVALLAHAIIMKALNSEGEKLFTLEDLQTLMRKVDPEVVSRVANIMLGVEEDDASGN